MEIFQMRGLMELRLVDSGPLYCIRVEGLLIWTGSL